MDRFPTRRSFPLRTCIIFYSEDTGGRQYRMPNLRNYWQKWKSRKLYAQCATSATAGLYNVLCRIAKLKRKKRFLKENGESSCEEIIRKTKVEDSRMQLVLGATCPSLSLSLRSQRICQSSSTLWAVRSCSGAHFAIARENSPRTCTYATRD